MRQSDGRDSIKSKVFEEDGVGFGEGKGKLSEESFPFPSPIFISLSSYTPNLPFTSRHTASTSMPTMQRWCPLGQ